MTSERSTVIQNVFEQAEITPSEIPAGDSDEFVIRLVTGAGYTNGASRLMLDFSGRLGSSCPTRLVNEASGYIETYVGNPDVTYTMRIWDMGRKWFVDRDHPASREGGRMLVVDFSEGMQQGDAIEIHWGETTRGFGPGANVTTVVPKPSYRDSVRVRYFEGHDKGLPDYGASFPGYERPEADAEVKLTYAVRPRELRRLRLIRKWNKALLIPHDRFWNVAEIESHDTVVEADAPAQKNEQGVFEFDSPYVSVKSKSAPFIDSPTMDDVFEGKNLYWGDLHAHSHHSVDCTRTVRMEMMPDDLMRFACDRAGLDFVAVTDHHTPAGGRGNMIQQDQWIRLVENVRRYNRPGDFTVFPGFELSCPRGDTVVVFNGEPEYGVIDQDWYDIRDVWRSLEGHDYISIPHFHPAGARLAEGKWWQSVRPDQEPVLEILSDHGSYECEAGLAARSFVTTVAGPTSSRTAIVTALPGIPTTTRVILASTP